MDIKKIEHLSCGVNIHKNATEFTDTDITQLKQMIYREKIVVLKNQQLSPSEFVAFGEKIGPLTEYYEEMYRHPEHKEIFVSSNVNDSGKLIGVPRTGKFWHSDYQFMPRPFAITITYPQIVPQHSRGTYFVDMATAYQQLSHDLKAALEHAQCEQTVRLCFKIRPQDLYRPIGEILQEIDNKTPAVYHPAVITHPVTGEKILYISQGFTQSLTGVEGLDNTASQALLQQLLAVSGQLDAEFKHELIELLPIEQGDIILWDNRRFVHHAKHSGISEPSKTFRLTVYDEFEFSA